MPSISDALKEVVQATQVALQANPAVDFGLLPDKVTPAPKVVYFMHGNEKEIMTTLQSMTDAPATKNAKYPLVALFRDIQEEVIQQRNGLSIKCKPHLAIFNLTDKTYRAEERKVKSFDKVLQPIFEEFIRQLTKSKAFGMPLVKDMFIKKWDCYFYGTQKAQANVLNDYVDAIEIETITLQLKNIC